MRPITLGITIVIAAIQSTLAMDNKELLEITKKPHSRENLLPELQIYPDARELKCRVEIQIPGQKQEKPVDLIINQKIVEGRYHVLRFRPPGSPGEYRSVVTYDQAAAVYRKWILPPDGKMITMTGTSAEGSRAISWHAAWEDSITYLSLEQHHDQGGSWTELYLAAGEVIQRFTGTAMKTK